MSPDLADPGHNRWFDYDALNRVTEDSRPGGASPYESAVLADSPMLYWRLGESAGPTALDISGNGYNRTYSGTNQPGQPSLIVDGDTSTQFNVNQGHIAAPTISGGAITGLELWIRTDFAGASGYFLGLHDGGGNVRMHVYHRNTGSIYVWRDGGNAIISDSSVSAGEPHHIAMWYDAGANQTYLMIDGVTQGWSYTGNAFAVTDPEVWIGGQRYNSVLYSIYQGKVDEVALYDQPVTASTFTNHYSLGSSVSAITNTLTYDANGNRTTLDDGTTVKNYGYQSSTNKLTSIDSLTIQRDASGNRIGDIGGTRSYTYNNANRLSAVLDSGVTTASYVHNALGQRSKKTVGSTDVIYLYDLGGNLIAEHDATGALIRDYVWMNGAPVAQIDQGEVFSYLHVDHLNTPRLATNDSQTVVWRWDSDAFGNTAPDEDPDGDLSGTTVNLRFPGQYFDGESGFYYNYFRTYDPSIGRYVESDPIGLDGGLNTYGYVGGNPLSFNDPSGRQAMPIGGDWYERREYMRQILYREAQTYVDAAPGAASQVANDAAELALFVATLDPRVRATGAICKEAIEQLMKRPGPKKLVCTTVPILCTLFTQGADEATSLSKKVLSDIRRVERIEKRVDIENAPRTVQIPK